MVFAQAVCTPSVGPLYRMALFAGPLGSPAFSCIAASAEAVAVGRDDGAVLLARPAASAASSSAAAASADSGEGGVGGGEGEGELLGPVSATSGRCVGIGGRGRLLLFLYYFSL